MHKIVAAAAPTVNKEIIAIPPRPKPGAQLLQLAHNGALNEFTNGQRFYDAGDGKSAEDAFIRSLVFNYWAWDRLGRSIAFLNQGHTERYLLKYPNEAVDCYFKSLNLRVSILDVSPTALESYKFLRWDYLNTSKSWAMLPGLNRSSTNTLQHLTRQFEPLSTAKRYRLL